MTNAERIRSMNDDELAALIGDIVGRGIEWFDARSCDRCKAENAGQCPHPEDGGCDKLDSVIEDWLAAEAE